MPTQYRLPANRHSPLPSIPEQSRLRKTPNLPPLPGPITSGYPLKNATDTYVRKLKTYMHRRPTSRQLNPIPTHTNLPASLRTRALRRFPSSSPQTLAMFPFHTPQSNWRQHLSHPSLSLSRHAAKTTALHMNNFHRDRSASKRLASKKTARSTSFPLPAPFSS